MKYIKSLPGNQLLAAVTKMTSVKDTEKIFLPVYFENNVSKVVEFYLDRLRPIL